MSGAASSSGPPTFLRRHGRLIVGIVVAVLAVVMVVRWWTADPLPARAEALRSYSVPEGWMADGEMRMTGERQAICDLKVSGCADPAVTWRIRPESRDVDPCAVMRESLVTWEEFEPKEPEYGPDGPCQAHGEINGHKVLVSAGYDELSGVPYINFLMT